MLEVRHLRMVDALQREGTVSKAAKRLHLTQPAVSHALKDLESRLGVVLFRRGNKRMVAMPEAERLLRAAEVVLTELRHTEEDLEQYRKGYQGVVRITTECYTGYNWLPPVLKRFGERYPKVRMEIVPDAANDPIGALRDHRLDLAIVHGKPAVEGVASQRLFVDEMIAIVPPGHPLAGKEYLVAEDFADQHFVSHGSIETNSVYRRVIAPAGVEPKVVSVIPLTEAVIQTVAAGIGIAVIARWLAIPEIDAGRLCAVRITPKGVHRIWYAAVLEHRVNSPALVDLIRDLKANGYAAACACR